MTPYTGCSTSMISCLDLHVVERPPHRIHRGARDPSTQLLQPLAGAAGEEARSKDGEQRLLVTEAVGEAP